MSPRPLHAARRLRRAALALVLSTATVPGDLPAATGGKTVVSAAPWVESDFPFFSSILDARKAGVGMPADNLAPRVLVLNLGHDCWACFDHDLLLGLKRGDGIEHRRMIEAARDLHLHQRQQRGT